MSIVVVFVAIAAIIVLSSLRPDDGIDHCARATPLDDDDDDLHFVILGRFDHRRHDTAPAAAGAASASRTTAAIEFDVAGEQDCSDGGATATTSLPPSFA